MYWQERMPSWVAGARTATWSRTIRLFRLGSQLASEAGGKRQERVRSRTGGDDTAGGGSGTSAGRAFDTIALPGAVPAGSGSSLEGSAAGSPRQLLERPQLQQRRVRGRRSEEHTSELQSP